MWLELLVHTMYGRMFLDTVLIKKNKNSFKDEQKETTL